MIAVIPTLFLLTCGIAAICKTKTDTAMNEEFIITPGPAPDSALNPLRANLSRLALSDEVSDEDREAIKEYIENL